MDFTQDDIKQDILKNIVRIAKIEGTDEKTLINDILSEAIEEYDNCVLLKKIKEADARIDEGESVSVKELADTIGVDLDEL